MLSIEAAKNIEDLFQIKAAIMRQKLEDVGGLGGVMEILDLSLEARKHEDYQKSLKIMEPLIDALKDQPFASNDAVVYVSISDRMERILYHHFCQTSSNQPVKNISEICPMDWIYRQYALIFFDLGDKANALDAAREALKWNPMFTKCRILFALLCSEDGRWEDMLKETVFAMKSSFRSVDLVYCFRFLRDYFFYKKQYKEAVYCSFLRTRFSSSRDIMLEIVNDMMMLAKVVNFDYKQINDEDMAESCKKYGFTPGFNPEVIAIAQRCYEEAFLESKSEKANYFAEIMAELKTEQEKRNSVNLRQLVERSRNIMS
jgi:tetratricopeptide (TPR) repeat protein